MGRSRIVENQGAVNIEAITTERDGKKSNADKVDRGDLKDAADNLKETKLLNFYLSVSTSATSLRMTRSSPPRSTR